MPLPPGLTLNPTTGVISGIPTTGGAFNYIAQVTDSLGATATTGPGGCPITVAGAGPPAPSPTGTCRTTLNLWQHSVSPQVETITDRNDDWTNCSWKGNKFFQGIRIDADTFGQNKAIFVRDSDTLTLHALQPAVMNHQGRVTKPYSFAVPFNAHEVRRETQDGLPLRMFGIEYVWEETPEFTYTWKTQRTNHGLKGFHHVQQIIMTYCSNAPVTLTIGGFDGTAPQVITLASTAGVFQKVVVVLTANKQLLYDYSVQSTVSDSTGAFQIWKNQLEIRAMEWGSTGDYVNYPLIGGKSGDSASL